MKLRAIIWCAVSTVQQTEDERFSLPAQERDALALCQREGWDVIDILRVPGHSRAYKSLDKLAADAMASPLKIDAFYKLIHYLEHCEFDVVVCRDANRFARKASLLHYIVESIVEDCGARIFSMTDGWVDEKNYSMWAAMKGYSSAQEVRWLKDAYQRGMDLRLEAGLPVNSVVPRSHRRVRNEITGRDERIEVNEELRSLFNDLATLILEGVGWARMERELYERYGHVDHTGKPYSFNSMWYWVMNPMWWGHNTRNYIRKHRGAWIYDETAPLPEGVQIVRNVIPAVWDNETAAKVRAELVRRADIRGRSKPATTHRYNRLCVCGSCGSFFVTYYHRQGAPKKLRCSISYNHSNLRRNICDQKTISWERIQIAFTQILEKRLSGETPDLFQESDDVRNAEARIAEIDKDIRSVEAQIDTLINEQSIAPDSVRSRYRDRIMELGERLDILKANHLRLLNEARSQVKYIEQEEMALEEVRQIGIEKMWELPDRKINQLLRSIMGRYKLVVYNREVVGVTMK
jgi:DNA invertase Pin-like site-specific DNA recombinase